MRIIVSPAKKMNVDTNSLAVQDLPIFLPKTEILLKKLQTLSYSKAKALWKCNDSIAEHQYQLVRNMQLTHHLTPALLAYEGIQYKYMGADVFTATQLAYAQSHLRILSGFYGYLKPFDGVTTYRLEMQAKLAIRKHQSLYEFWGNAIATQLFSETDRIVNLASKEYSKVITPYLTSDIAFVTCIFGELIDGKVVEKGTMCKMARGEMVRFMAETNAVHLNDVKKFNRSGYTFAEELSDASNYVFIKETNK